MARPAFYKIPTLISFSLVAFTCGLLGTSGSALAQDTPSVPPYPAYPVCDVKYMDSLKSKAWAEAQREVEVNNAIITKPSSVLALSCFDQFLKQVAEVDGVFSGSGNNAVQLDSSIGSAIGSAFSTFVSDNFEADLSPNEGAGTDFSSGRGYGSCNRIKELWTAVKCAAVPATHFGTIENFRAAQDSGTDLRSTSAYECDASAAAYESGAQASLDLANKRDNINRSGTVPQGYDYFSIARPNWCSTDPKEGPGALDNGKICIIDDVDQFCNNMTAVPTGQIVSYTQAIGNLPKDTFAWSYQCLNPGCYFDVRANADRIRYNAGNPPPNDLKCASRPYQ